MRGSRSSRNNPETTIDGTRDFGIGKTVKKLPTLRQIGLQATGVSWIPGEFPAIACFREGTSELQSIV